MIFKKVSSHIDGEHILSLLQHLLNTLTVVLLSTLDILSRSNSFNTLAFSLISGDTHPANISSIPTITLKDTKVLTSMPNEASYPILISNEA